MTKQQESQDRLIEYLQELYFDIYGELFCPATHSKAQGRAFANIAFSHLENMLDDGAPETLETDMLNEIACSYLYNSEEWALVLTERDTNGE